jgi:hypothetical protein
LPRGSPLFATRERGAPPQAPGSRTRNSRVGNAEIALQRSPSVVHGQARFDSNWTSESMLNCRGQRSQK